MASPHCSLWTLNLFSLRAALPAPFRSGSSFLAIARPRGGPTSFSLLFAFRGGSKMRSEEHTSELQSLRHLVCRLLLEKKNINRKIEKKLSRSVRSRSHT